jgi:hypothetical protein
MLLLCEILQTVSRSLIYLILTYLLLPLSFPCCLSMIDSFPSTMTTYNTTVVDLRGQDAGDITDDQFAQLGASFQKAFEEATGLNTQFCDPFFREITNVEVLSTGVKRQRRYLQQGHAASLQPSSAPTSNFTFTPSYSAHPTVSAAPSSEPTMYPTAAPTISAQPTVSAPPSSEPTMYPTAAPTISAQPTVSAPPSSEPTMYPTAAPSSAPTMYPTITPRASVFSFLLRIEGGCRGCNSDGLNGALLDPNLANQVSGRRLGLGPAQDVYVIDPSSGMVTERRLQEENQQDDCVCVAEAEKRGPRVSLVHCILLLDCVALPRHTLTYLIYSQCSYFPLL